VFAAMRDKDIDGILRALVPVISAFVMTRASNPRSADPAALAELARRMASRPVVEIAERPSDALARAWTRSPRIVVAGSIFLLGDIIGAMQTS
jgi:dihydrofolate synthase/folylpolyglutamate synthase